MGKVRRAQTPWVTPSSHAALYVTATGLMGMVPGDACVCAAANLVPRAL
ncbi:MAG: hypothetical protein AAFY38_01400 [Pseudomonadota bacterium]